MTFDFGKIDYQNTFIVHLRYGDEILAIVDRERQSSNPDDTNKYKAGWFFSTICDRVTEVERWLSCSGNSDTPTCLILPRSSSKMLPLSSSNPSRFLWSNERRTQYP